MRIGSLFSGIGGLELGLERAGLGSVAWQVEQDEYCRRVLARHWPDAERFEDVRNVGRKNLAQVDVICGGFPCQDVSLAGAGAGLKGARSGLWFEYRRIVEELRPRFVVVENVPGLVRRGLDRVLEGLWALGYEVEGTRLRAEDLGAPHRRERLFLVAHAKRVVVRDEQGRRGRAQRPRAAIPADDGEARPVGDALRVGRPRTEGESDEGWPQLASRGWWSSEPDVGRVVDEPSGGVVGRLRRARLRALGNAVVPACAEIIGARILEIERGNGLEEALAL